MKIKQVSYVIVQAGGKGERLEHYTFNKPKCLLSINGEPMLYRLFRHFPNARFIIIGDYLYDVLEKYLRVVHPGVDNELIRSRGKGTLAGLEEALGRIDDPRAPFNIVWSDLLFEEFPDGEVNDEPVIGLSRSFLCRWSLDRSGKLINLPSDKRGIAGFFCFPNRQFLNGLPNSGEFVKYLSGLDYPFRILYLDGAYELGTLESVYDYRENHSVTRFFNSIEIKEHVVVKRARDGEFKHLIDKEADWYEKVLQMGFSRVPCLITRQPFTIERIVGQHAFDIEASSEKKSTILGNILDCLADLHRIDSIPTDFDALQDVYYQKTIDRVASIRELIPNVNEDSLRVNGVNCRNPFHPKYREWFYDKVQSLQADSFALIHGDPTFSNILVDEQDLPWLIDPRGYFAKVLFYGDRNYDWAKLYYSVMGNYDQFNRKRFRLKVDGVRVTLEIASNGWESQTTLMRERFDGEFADIELIHALIWISLSGYVKDDYDSILASFYNGLYWLEQTESPVKRQRKKIKHGTSTRKG